MWRRNEALAQAALGVRRTGGDGWRAQLIEGGASMGQMLRPARSQAATKASPSSVPLPHGFTTVASRAVWWLPMPFARSVPCAPSGADRGWPVLPLRLLMTLTLVPALWGAVFFEFGLYES
jgi:hypothetical protein